MDKEEKLKILREETRLDFFSRFRIYRECKKAEELRNLCAAYDSTHNYSVDYSKANELEYRLRMKVLKYALAPVYKQYIKVERDGLVLEEFADNYLTNCMIERENEKGKAITKK